MSLHPFDDGWMREFNITFAKVRPNTDRDHGNDFNGTWGQDETSIRHGGTGH